MYTPYPMPGDAPTATLHVLRQAAAMLAEHRIPPGERVLAAVSGGADSVCLFDALRVLGLRVEVVHLDHGTRQGQSASDAAFVAELAGTARAPLHATTVSVAEAARAAGEGFEAHARRLRYQFFLRVAREQGIRTIATGHTADDQAETVLMRLLRGTTPHGLGGIPALRREGAVSIVRPLLGCTRGDVLAYLRARGLAWRDDASNADPGFARNRIRHELLPALRTGYNPAVQEALVRLATVQRDENAVLEAMTDAFLGKCATPDGAVDRAAFRSGDRALQRRAVTRVMLEHGVEPAFDRVEAAVEHIIAGGTGTAADLGRGLLLRNTRDQAVIEDGALSTPEKVLLDVPGEAHFGAWRVRASVLAAPPSAPLQTYCTATRQVLDAAAAGPRLVLRTRRPGDRIAPLGMAGTQKLKDWMIGRGIPRHERDALLIIEGQDGIAWIPGGPVSRHAAVTEHTREVVEIEVTRATQS